LEEITKPLTDNRGHHNICVGHTNKNACRAHSDMLFKRRLYAFLTNALMYDCVSRTQYIFVFF